MKTNLFLSILLLLNLWTFVMAAKERTLRAISITNDDVLLSPGISCIQIDSTITCYGINANRSVIHFINKNVDWSSWNMIVLENPTYDVKLDGISCVVRKNLPKCYLRMTNLGYEHLIELNPSKENWYQLCDYLATKPITILNQQKNIHIFSRTIKNKFYHKYVQNNQWHLNEILPKKKEFILIGESSCVSINDNQQIICFSRTNNPTRLAIWSQQENSFQWIDNQQENNIRFLSDLSCISIINEIICFVVSQDQNIYGMLCQFNLICSKWILINSNINYFKESKPISFVYKSFNNKYENLAIYALANNSFPYITTCQECFYSIDNWNEQWSQWMELTSEPLLSIESTFTDFQENKIYIIALTDQLQLTYSIFDYENHIPSPFYKLNNTIYPFII